jgi:hypothetical protein
LIVGRLFLDVVRSFGLFDFPFSLSLFSFFRSASWFCPGVSGLACFVYVKGGNRWLEKFRELNPLFLLSFHSLSGLFLCLCCRLACYGTGLVGETEWAI